MSIIQIFQTFILPVSALIIPVILFLAKRKDKNIEIAPRIKMKLLVIWSLLTLIILITLSYLSSGLINIYYGVPSAPLIYEGSIQWTISKHYQFLMPLSLFNNLVVVSILSGLIYGVLIALPKICEVNIGGSAVSSISASVSAVGSGVVCCSPSAIAVIAPAFGLILGPYIPVLFTISQLLLIYSFVKVVLPRIPFVRIQEKLILN